MHTLDIIIETPKGSRDKFNYDPGSRSFRFRKTLPDEMCFPFDIGFVPGTIGEDGDPLDVMIISELTGYAGQSLPCRIIGSLMISQTKSADSSRLVRNDRFLAIPFSSEQFRDVENIDQLDTTILRKIYQFFETYITREDKTFLFLGYANTDQAIEIITSQSHSGIPD